MRPAFFFVVGLLFIMSFQNCAKVQLQKVGDESSASKIQSGEVSEGAPIDTGGSAPAQIGGTAPGAVSVVAPVATTSPAAVAPHSTPASAPPVTAPAQSGMGSCQQWRRQVIRHPVASSGIETFYNRDVINTAVLTNFSDAKSGEQHQKLGDLVDECLEARKKAAIVPENGILEGGSGTLVVDATDLKRVRNFEGTLILVGPFRGYYGHVELEEIENLKGELLLCEVKVQKIINSLGVFKTVHNHTAQPIGVFQSVQNGVVVDSKSMKDFADLTPENLKQPASRFLDPENLESVILSMGIQFH